MGLSGFLGLVGNVAVILYISIGYESWLISHVVTLMGWMRGSLISIIRFDDFAEKDCFKSLDVGSFLFWHFAGFEAFFLLSLPLSSSQTKTFVDI